MSKSSGSTRASRASNEPDNITVQVRRGMYETRPVVVNGKETRRTKQVWVFKDVGENASKINVEGHTVYATESGNLYKKDGSMIQGDWFLGNGSYYGTWGVRINERGEIEKTQSTMNGRTNRVYRLRNIKW